MTKCEYIVGIIASALFMSACDEDTYGIGTSLTNQADELNIEAKSFYATTRTVVADSVLSSTNECYFGQIKDPETGTYVKSEFTTQFNILETLFISPDEKIVSRYDDKAAADSCDIVLYLSSPFSTRDSLTAMKMRAIELGNPIEEGQFYYSNFDPVSKGLIRQDGINKGKLFTYADLNETDSMKATSTYMPSLHITLNEPYTDKAGNTYNNFGTYILQQYHAHPEYFANNYKFTHNVCPGFYFEVTDGLGMHSKVTDVGLRVYYRVQGDTAVSNVQLTLAGTEEVLQTAKITNDTEALRLLAADNSCTYLKSPAGLYTEVTLPVDDIKAQHDTDSLIAAKIVFQRINNTVESDQQLSMPSTLLMVQKDSLTSFFEENKLYDNKSSFSASKATSNTYSFVNISNLITLLWNQKQDGLKQDALWVEHHPDWNKVLLVPVTPVRVGVSSSSTGTLTSIQHDMSLSSTKLVGGATPIEISVVYGKFNN